MVDHLAVSLFAWVVPELTICVARAAFQLALMPNRGRCVVLDFLVAERAGSDHWRLGGRVLGVPVKGSAGLNDAEPSGQCHLTVVFGEWGQRVV